MEDIDPKVLDKEREIEMQKEDLQSKPEAIRSKMVDGRIQKLAKVCLVLWWPPESAVWLYQVSLPHMWGAMVLNRTCSATPAHGLNGCGGVMPVLHVGLTGPPHTPPCRKTGWLARSRDMLVHPASPLCHVGRQASKRAVDPVMGAGVQTVSGLGSLPVCITAAPDVLSYPL